MEKDYDPEVSYLESKYWQREYDLREDKSFWNDLVNNLASIGKIQPKVGLIYKVMLSKYFYVPKVPWEKHSPADTPERRVSEANILLSELR